MRSRLERQTTSFDGGRMYFPHRDGLHWCAWIIEREHRLSNEARICTCRVCVDVQKARKPESLKAGGQC
jgi:hypothetical protein